MSQQNGKARGLQRTCRRPPDTVLIDPFVVRRPGHIKLHFILLTELDHLDAKKTQLDFSAHARNANNPSLGKRYGAEDRDTALGGQQAACSGSPQLKLRAHPTSPAWRITSR